MSDDDGRCCSSFAKLGRTVLTIQLRHQEPVHAFLCRLRRQPLAGGAADRELELSTSDGGRTWRPVTKHSDTGLKTVPETEKCLRHAKSCMVLALVLPVAVSLFPLTPAMQPISEYLNGDGAQAVLQGGQQGITTDSSGLQPLVAVFEAQPFRSRDDDGRIPVNFQGVIVISRAVPKPAKVCFPKIFVFLSRLSFQAESPDCLGLCVESFSYMRVFVLASFLQEKEDLSCVINGIQSRAIWLSWSMVLCR